MPPLSSHLNRTGSSSSLPREGKGNDNYQENAPSIGSWSQIRRLEFIDFRLCVEGRLNRSDIAKFFGISGPQASLDIRRYDELCAQENPPRQNIVYDIHIRSYVRAPDFKPLFPELSSAEKYLDDLLALSHGELFDYNNYFGFVPAVATMSFNPPSRNINVDVLFSVLEAIRHHLAMHIIYMSVSKQEKVDHLIAPHGFAFDGLRWHVRAYCYDQHRYLDFVLSRIVYSDVPVILAPKDRYQNPTCDRFEVVETDGSSDTEWNEQVDLILKANPELPPAARRAIELDYGMEENGTVVYTCRRALLLYALNWLHLTKEDALLPPEHRQIVLDNEEEIQRRLAGGH